jgi:MerR family transcriptional regulator, redox-sensitive transcriptional activator SoxR
MKIGEVAKRAGVRPSAIRFYERAGVLPTASRISGQRRFGPNVELYLTIIDHARQAGFTIAELKVLFNGFQEGKPASARWQGLAQKKLDELEIQMRRLQGIQRLLRQAMECRCVRIEDCGLLMRSQSVKIPIVRGNTITRKRGSRQTSE